MNPKTHNVKTTNHNRQLARPAVLAALVLVTIGSLTAFGQAPDAKVQPSIQLYQLAGPWQIGIVGNTGCGFSSSLIKVTLNASGTGTATVTSQSAACGGPSTESQTFTIESLSSNGSGTASLTCGVGCGFNYNIQVAPNGQVFNLVDVTDYDQFLAGTAVKQ